MLTESLRHDDHVERCSCLACRPIDVPTLRRTLLDMISWGIKLFVRYPGLFAIAVFLVALNRLPEFDPTGIVPLPVTVAFGGVVFLVYFVGIRAFVATVAAADLAGEPVRYRAATWHVLKRVPALIGLLALIVVIIVTLSGIVFLLSIPSFLWSGAIVTFLMNTVGEIGIIAVIPLGLYLILVIVGPPVYVIFKAWLAIEACVIGNYGPIEALRVSWEISTSFRGKLAVILGGSLASSGLLLVASLLPGVGQAQLLLGSIGQVVASSVGELVGIMWYAIYAHLYVQGILPEL